jgi:alpha-glucosidase
MPLDPLTRNLASQIVYQIFPERFAIGDGLTSEAKLASPAYDLPGAQKRAWSASPMHKPYGQQFFGGDLDGIREHLDYLAELGVTAVYLTPIFTAPSNHKYDATDYGAIDRMFGGEPALDRLLEALHERGMKLILDTVLNHVSDRHPWFLAARDGDPRFRDFFTFPPTGGHDHWKGSSYMPELNLANEAVLDLLYRRPDSLVQSWLERGIDGWRFDVAQDVGLKVAEDLGAIVRARFPDAWLIGEVFGFGGSWLESGQGYHGTMNYYFSTALLGWLKGELGAAQVNRAIADAREGCGLPGLLCSWTILSSHDTPRLASTLGGAARVRLAQLAQMTLPGVPMLYYGEELGMTGAADPDNRRPMPWDTSLWDHAQRAWVKDLLAIRQGNPALRYGDVRVLGDRLPGNALVFLRFTEQPGEAALVVINDADEPLRTRLLLPYSHWYDGVPLRDALGVAGDLQVQAASVLLDVAPHSGAVYEAFEPFEHYRYFKARNISGRGRPQLPLDGCLEGAQGEGLLQELREAERQGHLGAGGLGEAAAQDGLG